MKGMIIAACEILQTLPKHTMSIFSGFQGPKSLKQPQNRQSDGALNGIFEYETPSSL